MEERPALTMEEQPSTEAIAGSSSSIALIAPPPTALATFMKAEAVEKMNAPKEELEEGRGTTKESIQ